MVKYFSISPGDFATPGVKKDKRRKRSARFERKIRRKIRRKIGVTLRFQILNFILL
jgi:hypothetical protein